MSNPKPEQTPIDEAAEWEAVEAELASPLRDSESQQPVVEAAEWEAVEAELDSLAVDFQGMQESVNYQRAQVALRAWVDRLQLSVRERAGLEDVLQNLEGLLYKLEHTVVHIAVFGLVGRGKSSILNALLGQPVFETGPTHGVTQQVESTRWQVSRESLEATDQDILRVSLQSVGNSRIELIDTPGLDEVAGDAREAMARQIAKQADLILFVVAGDITRVEYDALKALREASKPILLVFNKVDQYPDTDRQLLYETLRDRRLQDLISPDEIVMTAADPLRARLVEQADGRRVPEVTRGKPQIQDLKLKILELLHREGKSLVALNTLLYADEMNEQILAKKRQICDRAADDILWHSVMLKAMVVALNPITVADLFSGAVIDVAMIVALSRLYGLPMTQAGAIRLFKQIALELGGISISELVVVFGLSSLKGVLGLSAAATGGLSLAPYIPVAVAQAAVAGVSTYGIGRITQLYLQQGAAWGPAGPKATVAEILSSLDEKSILNRIKSELKAKLEAKQGPS